jgi:eukaryotic-like serine/threonine-protein kinase
MNSSQEGQSEMVVAVSAGGVPVPVDDPRLIKALEEYRALLDAGGQPDRDEFQARHPEISEALVDCLDGLDFIHLAAPQLHSAVRATAASSSDGAIQPEAPLGDYRLVREIGRGGMGVVYEAVQISLGRRVALKVLPFAASLDAKQLQRFKNEAQASANLHHTNIVPIYAVGCERGVHFYAMQFIEGQTLAAMIQQLRWLTGIKAVGHAGSAGAANLASHLAPGRWAPAKGSTGNLDQTGPYPPPPARDSVSSVPKSPDGPTVSPGPSSNTPGYFRTVASLGVQAAAGLEHAHQLGVVHRDIKPANLMVDVRGNVWITDFGLAHCQSQVGLTMTGDLLGTLRYMSPEQALAKRVQVDHRTDIYSLGAMLYELLTLEPVFPGGDRQELLRQIAFEEPRPLRRLNKAIPAELETIVLKAIEKNPADRYATAQDLASDLERFLKDEPVRARRPTLLRKVRKWTRRHPGVVWTALASTAVLVLTVTVLALLANWWLTQEQAATRQQLLLTQDAEKKATGRLYLSLVAQAQASRLSRRSGQRFQTLEVLAEAATMARHMNLPEKDFLELRNVAIACLALPDLRVAKEWDGLPTGSFGVDFAGTLERYARGDRQGVVSVRRVADDTEIYHLEGMGPGESWPVFSPDGRFLALRRGDQFQVWNLTGQEPVKLLEGPHDTFGFSTDSRQLAQALPDGSLCLYDLPSGRQTKQLRAGPRARNLAFHPKDRRLAFTTAAGVQIRDLETGGVTTELAPLAGVWSLAWNPDGKTLAVACDRNIHIWDVASRKPIARLEGHKSDGIYLCYNHAGDLLASTCWDGMLRLWDPRTGQQLFNTQTWWTAPRFSPDDHFLAAGGDADGNKLRLWEVAPALAYRTLVRDPVLGRGLYYTSAVHPDGRLLAVGMWDRTDFWDLCRGNHLVSMKLAINTYHVLFEPSGALLTNGPDGLRRWPVQADSASAELLRIGPPQMVPVPGSACLIAQSRDGRVLASAQHDGGLVLHRDRPDQPVRLGPHGDARYIAVSPDGRLVATGSHAGTKVKVWQAQSGKLETELPVESTSRVGFSPDGKWLATSGGGSRLWAVDGWQQGPQVGGKEFAFSPDSRLLAVETGYGVVRLVDPDSGREYARLEDPNQDRASGISFIPDGTQLVTTNNDSHSVHVWDLRAIRGQLAKMGLDWDLPAYGPAPEVINRQPLRVHVELGDPNQLVRDRQELARQLIEQKRRALRANPNNAHLCNDLAWTYLTAPESLRDWKAALPLAQKAVQLDRQSMHRNTLGLAYYRAGRYQEAAETLQANLKDQVDGALTYDLYFLAMCHYQLGDNGRAKQFYDLAARWLGSHQESLVADALELAAFRAEAEGLLGLRQPANTKDKEPAIEKK